MITPDLDIILQATNLAVKQYPSRLSLPGHTLRRTIKGPLLYGIYLTVGSATRRKTNFMSPWRSEGSRLREPSSGTLSSLKLMLLLLCVP